jgi:dTDP-4-amino-4,6-dideoxygalactose transaminase
LVNKTSLSDLAIFGGTPAFERQLHVGCPNIGDRRQLLTRINRILDDHWLTNNGACVQEFEARVADYLAVKHCIAMCNATVALEIAIRALGLSGEVIIPSFTFVATAHALQWQGITPVFCDIHPGSHSIDPSRIEELITPRTTGIIGVHLWGEPCDVEALTTIARQNRVHLMFDAAHAFGCSHQKRPIGNFGEAEVFSFHATKVINTFEGGAVVTNDDHLAAKIRLLNNFGFSGFDNVIELGTNGKMNEVSAAMGLSSLDSLNDFVEKNRRNYQQYRDDLSNLPGVELFKYNESEKRNYQYVVLEIDEEKAGVSRDSLMKILWDENVLARRYFYPGCHRMEPYRSDFPDAGLVLPETEALSNRILLLPNGTAVSSDQITTVTGIVRLVMNNAREISRRLDDCRALAALTC